MQVLATTQVKQPGAEESDLRNLYCQDNRKLQS